MKPKIKYVHSPDIPDLPNYSPKEEDNFGFLMQLMIGPDNEQGEESFDVIACTPKWLAARYDETEIVLGRHHIIVFKYDYKALMNFIEKYVSHCTGDTWQEIVTKLARLGKWEFEDYTP